MIFYQQGDGIFFFHKWGFFAGELHQCVFCSQYRYSCCRLYLIVYRSINKEINYPEYPGQCVILFAEQCIYIHVKVCCLHVHEHVYRHIHVFVHIHAHIHVPFHDHNHEHGQKQNMDTDMDMDMNIDMDKGLAWTRKRKSTRARTWTRRTEANILKRSKWK
jgi:hypothetical protein